MPLLPNAATVRANLFGGTQPRVQDVAQQPTRTQTHEALCDGESYVKAYFRFEGHIWECIAVRDKGIKVKVRENYNPTDPAHGAIPEATHLRMTVNGTVTNSFSFNVTCPNYIGVKTFVVEATGTVVDNDFKIKSRDHQSNKRRCVLASVETAAPPPAQIAAPPPAQIAAPPSPPTPTGVVSQLNPQEKEIMRRITSRRRANDPASSLACNHFLEWKDSVTAYEVEPVFELFHGWFERKIKDRRSDKVEYIHQLTYCYQEWIQRPLTKKELRQIYDYTCKIPSVKRKGPKGHVQKNLFHKDYYFGNCLA